MSAAALWRLALPVCVGTVATGFWALVEIGYLFPHSPEGYLGTRWKWVLLPVTSRRWLAVVAAGVGVMVVATLLYAVRSRLAGRGTGARGLSLVLRPAWPLAGACAAAALMQLCRDNRWAVASYMTVVICGRLCIGAMAWRALNAGVLFGEACKLLGRTAPTMLLILALCPLLFMQSLPVRVTGDEPSYLHMTNSIVRDFDLRFDDTEIREVNYRIGIPASVQPHLWASGNPMPPLHWEGLPLVLIPAFVVGDVLGCITAACRAFMLCVYGLSMALTAVFAWRLTRRPGPSILAALTIAVSFPMLGMSYQLYPEPIVALLVLCAALLMSRAIAEGTPLTTARAAGALAICCLLPWFHTKFSVLSAGIAIVVVFMLRPWRWKALLVCGLVTVVGTVVYYGIHLPIYGRALWKQSELFYCPEGMLGLLVDSEIGLVAFAPWVLMLPVGRHAVGSLTSRRRLLALVLVPAALLYVVTANSDTWAAGGETPSRFALPIVVLLGPWLAGAFAAAGSSRRYLMIALCIVPIAAAITFFDNPWTAYPPTAQRGRTILDLCFDSFSWRELFPHFQYRNRGISTPLALVHGLVAIAILGTFAAGLARRWPRRMGPVAGAVATLLALVAAARLCNSPNWPMTATRMFAQQARTVRRMESHHPGAVRLLLAHRTDKVWGGEKLRLHLPAALKPMDLAVKRTVVDETSLSYKATLSDNKLLLGPAMDFPSGWYRVAVIGAPLEGTEATGGGLKLGVFETTVDNLLRIKAKHAEFQAEARPPGKSGNGHLIDGVMELREDTPRMGIILERAGSWPLRIDWLELAYLGPHPPDRR